MAVVVVDVELIGVACNGQKETIKMMIIIIKII